MARAGGRSSRADPLEPQVQVQSLAERWLTLLDSSTAGNQDWQVRLDLMNQLEPEAQRESGISPELKCFIMAAMGEVKLRLYARYLRDDGLAARGPGA